MHQHHRHTEGLARKHLVHGLIAPESIIARMIEKLAPKTYLFQAAPAPEFAGRARLHEHIVVVKVTRPPLRLIRASSDLFVDIRHVLLTKGAVMKPIVAHPTIH